MEMTEARFGSGLPVDGYGPGYFLLGESRHFGPLAIFPEGIVDWHGLTDTAPLIERANQIDVLFLGTGADIAALPAAERTALEAAGLAFEVMATPPACRTYNVLLAEARRVALAVIPV